MFHDKGNSKALRLGYLTIKKSHVSGVEGAWQGILQFQNPRNVKLYE